MKFNLQNNTLIITEEIIANTNGDKRVYMVAKYNGKTQKFKLYKEALKDYFEELWLKQSCKIQNALYNACDEKILLCYIDGYEIALKFERWVKCFYSKEELINTIVTQFDFNSSYPKAQLNTMYGVFLGKVKKGE